MVVIKVPIQPLAEDVRSRHSLKEEFFDVRLEGDSLVLYFRRRSPEETSTTASVVRPTAPQTPRRSLGESVIAARPPPPRPAASRRRRRTKRNRMKTKGWQVVAKITNSKGQTAVVYKPFVDVLFGQRLTPAQERAKVAEVLRSNGNDPTESSIEYFLMNTREYLEQVNKQEAVA